jgi:hypothetical protein
VSTPADDVAAQIAAAGLGWALGTNLFASDVLPVYQSDQATTGSPSSSVFCSLYGGYLTPTRYGQDNYAVAGPGVQAREPRVMVYVRSPRFGYYAGLVNARAVKDSLHDRLLQIGTTGAYYDACRIVDAEPLLLSVMDTGESLFSMNCHLYYDV